MTTTAEPPGTPTPRSQRWKEQTAALLLVISGGAGVVIGSDSPTGTTYMCAHFPTGPRSPPRRGRWPSVSPRILCPGPGCPAVGMSRHCSGWPVRTAEWEMLVEEVQPGSSGQAALVSNLTASGNTGNTGTGTEDFRH